VLVAVVQHWVEPDRVEAAEARIDEQGEKQAAVEGFLFRYRLRSQDDPTKITTVTGWESREALDRWYALRDAEPRTKFGYLKLDTELHDLGSRYLPT
jgi:heme-degrading monooxygenase HmoA